MPMAPPRACRRCGRANCQEHTQQQVWAERRVASAPRIRGRKLQRIRKQMMIDEKLCRLCKAAGRHTLGSIVDHIVPIADGGPDVQSNRQLICVDCHASKTLEESMHRRNHAK